MKHLSKIFIVFFVLSLIYPNPSFGFLKKKEIKEGKGYVGTLPEISKYFRYKKGASQTIPEAGLILENLNEENLIKGPVKDPVFSDVIIKKKKPSPYIDELLAILPVVEKLKNTVQMNSDIQKYNAGVNTLDLYVTRLKKEYETKPEGYSNSYNMLQDVNYRAKVLGNLKYEANFYSKYKAELEEQYSEEYLKYHDGLLIEELDKTISIIKTECEKGQFGE